MSLNVVSVVLSNEHLLLCCRSDREAKDLKEKFLKGKSPNLVSMAPVCGKWKIPKVDFDLKSFLSVFKTVVVIGSA